MSWIYHIRQLLFFLTVILVSNKMSEAMSFNIITSDNNFGERIIEYSGIEDPFYEGIKHVQIDVIKFQSAARNRARSTSIIENIIKELKHQIIDKNSEVKVQSLAKSSIFFPEGVNKNSLHGEASTNLRKMQKADKNRLLVRIELRIDDKQEAPIVILRMRRGDELREIELPKDDLGYASHYGFKECKFQQFQDVNKYTLCLLGFRIFKIASAINSNMNKRRIKIVE
ncbi:MAG: hypothetical protein H6912_04655 [Kordiimonadaceae bacterium]|nr:hypothetical protein [Kordiimonadaceae bacterium]